MSLLHAGPEVIVCGQQRKPDPPGHEQLPSAELETFFSNVQDGKLVLADGTRKPVVYVGFGSTFLLQGMTSQAAKRNILEMAFEALAATGCAGAVQSRGLDESMPELPEHCIVFKEAPHDWLFEQCAAFVCHGGCDTIQRALSFGEFMTDIVFVRCNELLAASSRTEVHQPVLWLIDPQASQWHQ